MTADVPEAGSNDRTLHTYEGLVDRYVERSSREPSPLVEVLAENLEPGARILEIGTGAGWDALALERAGYRVDRTDAATGFVVRLHGLGFPARVLNVLHDDLGGPYDAIYASAVLLHFSPTELRQVLTAALDATRPGGLLAATLKKGDSDEWSERKMEAPRYFHYWREPHLADLLTASGWETTYLDETTPADAHERWITVLARRPVDVGGAPR